MTVFEAICHIDELKRNTYSNGEKVCWLYTLESMVKQLVIDTHEGGESISLDWEPHDYEDDHNMPLIMQAPYDKAYIHWMEAQIHYYNEDIDMYNSAISMFNTVFDGYKAYYKQNHRPKGSGRFRF